MKSLFFHWSQYLCRKSFLVGNKRYILHLAKIIIIKLFCRTIVKKISKVTLQKPWWIRNLHWTFSGMPLASRCIVDEIVSSHKKIMEFDRFICMCFMQGGDTGTGLFLCSRFFGTPQVQFLRIHTNRSFIRSPLWTFYPLWTSSSVYITLLVWILSQ